MWKLLSGLFLGWSLGANDSANVFGTGVATGTVHYRLAIWLTAVFVVLGAVVEGPKCMETLNELSRLVPLFAFCCMLSAGITMTVLTILAVPASSSQAVIGAMIGAGLISGSADFSKLYIIVSCWLFTPISGMVLAYFLYVSARIVLDRTVKSMAKRNTLYFIGILLAGSYGAYTLGTNNVANVTGLYVGSGLLTPKSASFIGGLAISTGVLTYSKKVMMTVGKGIVPLDPLSAFVALLAEALTLHLFTQIGVPVSSSQAIVGAVLGIGLVGGLRTVSIQMLSKIAAGWILTPVSAGLLAFLLIKMVIWTI
jgi:PiT family inorganic phosphate transporter